MPNSVNSSSCNGCYEKCTFHHVLLYNVHMNMSASVQTGRARPKVSTPSRITLGTKLSLTSRKLKESKLRIFVIKKLRIF